MKVGGGAWYARSFCTSGNYTTLRKVSIYAADPYRMNPSVALHSARDPINPGPDDRPGTHLLTLTNPTSYDASYSTPDEFTTTGYRLAPYTLYWIVVKQAGGWFRISGTNSHEVDDGAEAGWSLGRSASNWDDWQDQRMRIGISAGVDSVSHSPAHFPRRSCKEQDYPSTARTVSTGTAGDTFIATIAATDIDGDTLTYSLTGPDADAFDELFAFNTATGEVRVKEGVTVDHRYWSRFRYSVRVNVTDGEDEFGNAESQATIDDSFDLRINISNGNLPGTITPTTDSPVVGAPMTTIVFDPNGRIVALFLLWGMAPSPTGPFTLVFENQPTYTPVAQDVGKYLKVWAIYWVEGGGHNAILTLVLENPVAAAGQGS